MRTSPEPRYAIYFVPGADSTLYRLGASVLGYDCYTGRDTELIDSVNPMSWPKVVQEPRVYGFHATLKPPFYLPKGLKEADLANAVLSFASDMPATLVGELAVRALGSFIALIPKRRRPLLDQFAQACVQEFDRFRAPMTEPERQRRLTAGLSGRQIENLNRWGYPYLLEDFRFHMTLTGALPLPERSQVLQFLCKKFEQMPMTTSLIIDQIVVARQIDKSSPFQVVRQAQLGQSADRPYAYSY